MSASIRRRTLVALLAGSLALVGVNAGGADAQDSDPPPEVVDPDAISVVTLSVPDRATLGAIVSAGYDLDHDVEPTPNGFTVTAIVTNAQIAELAAMGVGVAVGATEDQIEQARRSMMAERSAVIATNRAAALEAGVEETDTVVIARADHFTSTGDTEYLSVEAKSSDGSAADLSIAWDAGPGTEIGDGGSGLLSAFVDAGVYLYHRGEVELSNRAVLTIAEGAAAGNYTAVGAEFGAGLDPTVAGTVQLVDDGTAAPTLGCATLVGFTPGSIALVDRGSCPFTTKVANAQAAGAVATIVANNLGGAPFAMVGSDPSITIPAAMISQADGATIGTGLPAVGSLGLVPPLPPPTRVRVTSSGGGSAEADVTEWLGQSGRPSNAPYFQGFLDHYPDAYELMDIIEELHAQYPDLTDIVELPNPTNGYRRRAMHLSDGGSSSRVVLTSAAWGHEGGNDLTIAYVDPGAADAPLTVSVSGNDIVVSLATDASGAVVSTAAQVAAAINASPAAAALVSANTYRGNAGNGIVESAASESMTDALSADPAEVPREPFRVKALRIGKHRDGTRPGVLTYSQEHAREWQTPLVNIETAYRLLNNYQTDAPTRQLVDNLDIFIIPTVNPDGALYSYYDFGSQRKNMTNHCGPGEPNDINARNAWGVDNNRNQPVGSLFDGFDGASTSCTSAVYAGPGELSEPESQNLYWLADTFRNIEFAMNIHSSGNYFMWSPGAYSLPNRETLPRPGLGTEEYFYDSSSRILSAIQEWRGLAVTPARTGPIADVLYSAAGNSGDMLWYERGIYAWNFEVGTSFQPDWDEAFQQMMEFSNGVLELYEVAGDWATDRTPPRSWLVQPGRGTYAGPVEVAFDYDEPADVYYTVDGSNPTFASPLYRSAGVREGGEQLLISSTTTIKWFAVDVSGNVERNYVPGSNGSNKTTITIGG